MIVIESRKNKYMYNLYHIAKAFFPEEEFVQRVDEKQEPLVRITMPGGSCFSLHEREIQEAVDEALACASARENGSGEEGGTAVSAETTHATGYSDKAGNRGDGARAGNCALPSAPSLEEMEQAEKKEVTRRAYRFFERTAGRGLAWGTLTGVRPTKLIMEKIEAGQDRGEIISFLKNEYYVSEEKARLGYEIACREKTQLSKLNAEGGYSLYVGIPFCPSVCSYCSFSSSPIGAWKDRVELYLDALIKELEAISRMAGERRPDTVYIGGGTPTTLEPAQLDRLLRAVTSCFDLSHVKEFTVEAGRPDSITEEKLETLREFPVSRISVNPQTMQQRTLDLVGRRHTVEQVTEAFHLARRLGFDNINMDLIAGLPGETPEDMDDTLRQIEALAPDSLTIHALAIKRAAKFGQEGRKASVQESISHMIDAGARSAERMGLVPYYMYRQKNIAGNFENVGYAKVDKAGIYNILIMEERQSILAAGAGASTKILLPKPIVTERGKEMDLIHVENVKSITDYISRVDEMIERKGEWLWR